VSAQDSLGLFRSDPVTFFAESSGERWVGVGRFLMNDYSDTLWISPDSTEDTLRIRRVLVRTEDSLVVSRGGGFVYGAGNAAYAVSWSELKYPDLTGSMAWTDDYWEISLKGEWKAWSLRIRYDSPRSFVASVARSVGSFPPIELATMTYRLISPAE
jgi:hypothetical protein